MASRGPLYVMHVYFADASKQREALRELQGVVQRISGGDWKSLIFAKSQVALGFTSDLDEKEIKQAFSGTLFGDELEMMVVQARPIVGYLSKGVWDWFQERK